MMVAQRKILLLMMMMTTMMIMSLAGLFGDSYHQWELIVG
jgi:hypothetical protein